MNVTTMQQFKSHYQRHDDVDNMAEATGTNEAEDLAWQLFESSDRTAST